MNDLQPVDDVLLWRQRLLGYHSLNVLPSEKARVVFLGVLLVGIAILVVVAVVQLGAELTGDDVLRRVVAMPTWHPILLVVVDVDRWTLLAGDTLSRSYNLLSILLSELEHGRNNAQIIFINKPDGTLLSHYR